MVLDRIIKCERYVIDFFKNVYNTQSHDYKRILLFLNTFQLIKFFLVIKTQKEHTYRELFFNKNRNLSRPGLELLLQTV
ncbi:MAG: hypothetical protein ACI9YB_002236 [Halioglobus sp.]|jgi:hypothetical protein